MMNPTVAVRGLRKRSRFGAALCAVLVVSTLTVTGWSDAVAGRVLSEGGSAAPAQDGQPAEEAEWTVLVYMAADNNLEPAALDDLAEMAEAAGPGVNIVALIDRSQLFTSEPAIVGGDFSTTKMILIDENGPAVVEDIGELEMVNPANLAWFVWYGLTNFPAERTAFFMWDHGGGPLQTFGGDDDEGGEDFLSIPEIQQGLGSGLRAAGVDKFDIVGFDACLNAAFDVASAMTSYADYFIASEELEPGEGWDWTALDVLSQGDDVDAVALGQSIIDRYEGHVLANSGVQDYTLSLVDLEAVERLGDAMTGFVSAIRDDLATSGPALLQARQGIPEFGVVGTDPRQNYNLVDLGAWLARLPETLPDHVLRGRNAVYEALGRAVVHQVVGPGHADATGLSIYLPISSEIYFHRYDEHLESTGWRLMLKELLGGGVSVPSPEETEVGNIDLTVDSSGWLATLPLDEQSVAAAASASGIFGVPNSDGTATALSIFQGSLAAGGLDQVQASWNYAHLTLGGQAVTADMKASTIGVRAAIPGIYVDPTGSQLQAVMSVDLQQSAEGLSVASVSILDTSGTAGAITPVSGSQFVPLLVTVDGFEVVSSELGSPIDPSSPSIGVSEIPSGSAFYAAVEVTFPDGTSVGDATTATRP